MNIIFAVQQQRNTPSKEDRLGFSKLDRVSKAMVSCKHCRPVLVPRSADLGKKNLLNDSHRAIIILLSKNIYALGTSM